MMKRIGWVIGVLSLYVVATAAWAADEGKGHICFRVIDADKDGKVTFEEFTKHFGEDRDAFKAIDRDGNGTLSHDEYHHSLGHGAS